VIGVSIIKLFGRGKRFYSPMLRLHPSICKQKPFGINMEFRIDFHLLIYSLILIHEFIGS